MGKLKVIRSGPLATIQDKGRFGYRKFGVPQSGVMDTQLMELVNEGVGNEEHLPVLEFALLGMKFQAVDTTLVAYAGCRAKINGQPTDELSVQLMPGDMLELSPPTRVYAYLAVGGAMKIEALFDSYSTYLPGSLGGLEGRALKAEDVLETEGNGCLHTKRPIEVSPSNTVRFIKGPESHYRSGSLSHIRFRIDPSSNRVGVRLKGPVISCKIFEIKSSAVLPGTIQLPPNGQPIVLMNDCQTTGGYPRIGKVVNEDLRILAQTGPGKVIELKEVEF